MKITVSRLRLMAAIIPLALLSIPGVGFAREKAIDTPIYQDDNLSIAPYSHGPVASWCKQDRTRRFGDPSLRPYGLLVSYAAGHMQRKAFFSPGYEAFVLQHVVPAIQDACTEISEVPDNFHVQLDMRSTKDIDEHAVDSNGDRFVFRYRQGAVVRVDYHPVHLKKMMTEEEVAALTPPETLDRSSSILSKVGPFTIYPHDFNLCSSGGAEVDAVFDIPAAKRDSWIAAKYGNTVNGGFDLFFERDILPGVRESCGNRVRQVYVHFYEKEATSFWDMMAFRVPPPGYTQSRSYDGIISVHNMSARAKNLATLERNRQLLGVCAGGPFCDEMGGIFLDAIYRNDIKTIRLINLKLNIEYRKTSSHSQTRQLQDILSNRGVAGAEPTLLDLNFLVHLSGKYMYDYSRFATSKTVLTGDRTAPCFRDGAMTVDTRAKTDVIHYEDQYGVPQGAVGGIQVGAKYRVNPEFIELCDMICGSASGEMGDFLADMFGLTKSSLILSGLEQVVKSPGCESPEIQQFERNLVAMTMHFLSGDPDRPYNVTPNDQRALDEHERVKANEELARVSDRNTAFEKEQAMNSEIGRVKAAIFGAIDAKKDAYWSRVRQGGLSPEELSKLNKELREFEQSQMKELQNAVSEIRVRYE